ncbi:MAG: hypothetical protein HOK11_12635 [Rhodospirillaceae bacterium]|jgi:hypothetical protein|nr:hypothetical protein [Rhodospirillaceae bacterium]
MSENSSSGAQAEITPAARDAFERDGFHLIRPLYSRDEAGAWRDRINAIFDLPTGDAAAAAIAGSTHTLADGITTNEEFWPVIFYDRLLSTVRALLGDDIRYTQHSDLHINLPGGRWHRDSACREFGVGEDWDERETPYRVVRIAIYLSDFADSGSSIVVLPGTHRRETRLGRREYVLWNKARSFMRKRGHNDMVPHWFLTNSRKVIQTQPGDCVIFDQRLTHAGGVLGGANPKYAMYLSYGLDNKHSRNHRAFFLDRPTYSRNLPADLKAKLADHNLLLTQAQIAA